MIVAADDVGHAHIVVVDHHAKVIGWTAVGAQDDQVVQLAVGNLDLALNGINDHALALNRAFEADNGIHACRCLSRVAIAPGAVVACARGAHGVQLLTATVTAIGVASL